MSQPAAIATRVTITAKDPSGNNVAKVFNSVYNLSFDYFKGIVNIVDSVQGSFYFGLTTLTTITYTVNGTATTIVIS